MKYRLVHGFQKYLLNPPVRLALAIGVLPPTYSLLETVGRKTGKPRRTPVGNGLDGDTFWIVAEHGRAAGYVRNIEHNPKVKLKIRRGRRVEWRSGTARALPDDDTRERQRTISRGHPGRALNAFVVRVVGTDLLTVRIDLDPP
jgi:deazaflavin-dependent oxidoreductase (nitroreductase family)